MTSEQITDVLTLADRKISENADDVGRNQFPSGALWDATSFTTTTRYGWTSGFYPAQFWLMYQVANDPARAEFWLTQARRGLEGLAPLRTYRGSHDLGFMVGLPFGLATQLDPDPQKQAVYTQIWRQAAASLATRWNPNVKAIRSDYYDGQWGLIIDSAMNEAYMIEAGAAIGGAEGQELTYRGTEHMRTLAKYFVRADGSTVHRQTFNPKSGGLVGAFEGQGLATDSTWSRGQAWAIYGFAKAYTTTRDPQFLAVAQQVSAYWLDRLPAGCVPAWDFDVTTANAPIDSSAAAIAAAGLLVLADADPTGTNAAQYRQWALTALGTLSRPEWTIPDAINPGVLQRQSHAIPTIAQEGSYSWGDAYFLEALSKVRTPAPNEAK